MFYKVKYRLKVNKLNINILVGLLLLKYLYHYFNNLYLKNNTLT